MKKTINLFFAHGIILLLSGILFSSSFALKAQSCNANFTYAVGGSANKTVSFTSASNDTLAQHEWYFGDGTTSALINPVKTYLNYGVKTITHLVKKGNICADTFITTVTLNNSTQCVANFIDTIVGNTVEFYTRSTGNNLSYYWNFGDGTNSTLQNPIKVYSKADTFLVCLTVRNMFDSTCFNTKCSTIVSGNGNTPCVANFRDTVVGNSVYFNNRSTGNNLSYYWNFGDGTTSTLQNPIKVYNKTDTFLVCLTVRNMFDSTCFNTKCSTIVSGVANTPCVADFRDTVVGNSVYFNNRSTGNNLSYYWNFGDGTTSTLQNPIKVYNKTDTFLVCLTVRNMFDSSCFNTKCSTIVSGVANTPCVADFRDTVVGNSVYFNNRSTGNNLSYYWNFGDGTTSNLQNPIKVYNKVDTFLVCLTVRNMFDTTCFNTKCSTIVSGVANTPCVAYFIDTAEIDTNAEIFVYFNNQSTGNNLSYYWDFGDSTTSTIEYPIHKYTKSGFYLVCLTIFSNSPDSCTHTYCDSILINSGTNIKNQEVVTLSTIYPIPANDEINLDLNSLLAQEINFVIIDMTGKVCLNKVYKTAIGQNNIKLDISDLLAGFYIVQIDTPQGKIIKKMIK